MEPSFKKQKINDTHECAILGIKVTRDSSVSIGNDSVWAPMLLLFSSFFDSFSSTHPITSSMLDEAREKTKNTRLEFQEFIQDQYKERKKELPILLDLNVQRFWLLYTDHLILELLSHLKLDHPNSQTAQVLKIFYHGALQLHCYIPEEGLHVINKLSKTLDEALMGEDFWTFNPILLTQAHIWARSFLDDVLEDHTRNSKKAKIARVFSLASSQHPFPPLKQLSEAQVCDQQLALRLARGEINIGEDNEDGQFYMPALWNLGTINAYIYDTSGYILSQ